MNFVNIVKLLLYYKIQSTDELQYIILKIHVLKNVFFLKKLNIDHGSCQVLTYYASINFQYV